MHAANVSTLPVKQHDDGSASAQMIYGMLVSVSAQMMYRMSASKQPDQICWCSAPREGE